MKQLACPSKPASSSSSGEEAGDVLGQHLGLEVGDRAGLRGGQVGGVAEREHVRLRRCLQRALVGRDEAERVAEAGRALDVGGAAVQRDGDEQVEVELAAVVGAELAADAVDLAGVELGHQLDLLLGEQARQVLGGDRLGEGAVERGRVDELGAVADAALAQVPVGEEGELERRDRALDRHVDQVHDQPAAVEALERRCAAPSAPSGL